MAKVEKTDQELEDDAKAASASGTKNPADAAAAKHAELLKKGTAADRQAEIVKLQAEIDELSKPPVQEFPKMKYHPDQPATTVQDAAQEKALGSGWVDTMADFPDVKAKAKASGHVNAGAAKVAHDDVAAGRK